MAMTPKFAGDMWISKRTKQLRYGGGDSEDQWLQPISVYTAGEEILRGHLVSVRLDGGSSYDNVVIKTVTSQHLKVVGIAMEHVTIGQKVHVLPYGKFTYNSADGTDTYFPAIADSDRGSMLYAAPTAGQVTLDRNAALLGALNLIQIGYITNANITAPSTGSFDIELQLEGDGRGPIENTQFELPFGENVLINNSIPRVLAFSPSTQATPFNYLLQLRRPTAAWPTIGGNKYNTWIAVYSTTRAVILVMGPGGTGGVPAPSSVADANRLNFIVNQFSGNTVYVPLYAGATAPTSWGNATTTDLFDISGANTRFGNSVDTVLRTAAYTLLPASNSYLTRPSDPVITSSLGIQTIVNLTYLCGANPGIAGGPIFVEWDSALADYFGNSAYLAQGKYTTSGGSVVIADKRFADRSNVAGIYIGPTRGTAFTSSETGIFLRKGLFTSSLTPFIAGERYFLGDYGQITTSANLAKYPESLVEIGTALTSSKLMVDISSPATPKGADYPIGAVKPVMLGNTIPESGFLIMDGSTLYQKTVYPELYQLLVNAYGAGNVDVTPGSTFKIPKLTNPITGVDYQIKASSFGYQPLTSVLNKLSLTGTTSASPGSVSVDITSLKTIGPYGDGYVPNIDSLVIKLFVDVDGAGAWKEIPPGFFVSNGILYGYVWKVTSSGSGDSVTYTLITDLGGGVGGSGLAYATGATTVTALTSKSYRLSVYKPEAFARYYTVGAEVLNPNHNLPPTSIAVANYVDTSVSTQRLYVRGEVDVKDKVDFHLNYDVGSSHNPLTPVTGEDACARLSVTGDGVLLLSNTVNGIYNVFGIASATGATANNRYIINNAGTLEISSGVAPGVNYSAIRASGFQTVSTIKAKENIKPFEASALNIINQTKVMEYNLKNDPDIRKIGFIAENTHEILAGKEHNHMNVDESVVLLMKAIQELSNENARLKKRQEAILRSLKKRRR